MFLYSRSHIGKWNYLEEVRFWEHPPWSGTALRGLHHKTHGRVTVKQDITSGQFQEITFTVITLNRESNCTCQEKSHSQSHCDTSTWPELQVRPWMWCWEAAYAIIGTLKETEIYQMRGQVSHDSQYWMQNLQTDFHGPGSGWQRSKQSPGAITSGQRCGKTCQMQLNEKKYKSGLSKNRSSTNARRLRGIYSLIQQMRSSRKLLKMRGESCKFRCQQLCLERSEEERTRKLVAICSQDQIRMHRWSRRKELSIKIMNTTLQEHESIHWTIQFCVQIYSYASSNAWCDDCVSLEESYQHAVKLPKKVSVEEKRAQNFDRFLRGRHIAYMIYKFSVQPALMKQYKDSQMCSQWVCSMTDDVQDFDVSCDHALLSLSELPSDMSLEGQYK